MTENRGLEKFPPIAALTVTQNRCALVLRMLSGVRELDYPREQIDIFVVDSASSDNTVESIRRDFPDVNLSVSNENLGIAAGFNMAIKSAMGAKRKYKYYWLLDSDVQVERQTLLPLVEVAESDPLVAVVGSAVYEPGRAEELVTAGFHIDWKNCNVCFNVPGEHSRDSTFDVELIPACSSLTRAELYEKQGLWDERLWLYWGDTEWCMRSIRNGYRVCCAGKSKVWHRNWANVKVDYYFAYMLHDRVRSALLFNLCYSPKRSLSGIRRFILTSHLKAAFENLTLRPNFSRAHQEGVKDFLRGDFSRKDFSAWSDDCEIADTDGICSSLVKRLPKQPRIILNQIGDEFNKTQIRRIFERHFDSIKWEEIPVHKDFENVSVSGRLREYMFFLMPQLLLRIVTLYKRRDVIISPMALPCLYNIAAARYTVLLSPSMRGCVRKNRICSAFWNVLKTFARGFWAAYIALPRALNNCEELKGVFGSK